MSRPIVSPREKTKTRGEQSHYADDFIPAREDAPGVQAETIKLAEATTIKVTKQSLDVFLLMIPENDEVVKDVLWDRFVRAMVDAGFSARNSSGSAVSFKKYSGNGGKIVFHKPHPVPKIDPVLLRVIGKRMAKWFRELFVLCDDSIEDQGYGVTYSTSSCTIQAHT